MTCDLTDAFYILSLPTCLKRIILRCPNEVVSVTLRRIIVSFSLITDPALRTASVVVLTVLVLNRTISWPSLSAIRSRTTIIQRMINNDKANTRSVSSHKTWSSCWCTSLSSFPHIRTRTWSLLPSSFVFRIKSTRSFGNLSYTIVRIETMDILGGCIPT